MQFKIQEFLLREENPEQVEIDTGQGVSVFSGRGLAFLSPSQHDLLNRLAVLKLNDFAIL